MTAMMTEPAAKVSDTYASMAAAQQAAAERQRAALLAEVPPEARQLCRRITKLLDGLGATGAALAKLRQELEGGIIAAVRGRDGIRDALVELNRQRRDLAIERAPGSKHAAEHAAQVSSMEQRLLAASDVVRRLNDLHADLAGLARQLGVAKAVAKSAAELT